MTSPNESARQMVTIPNGLHDLAEAWARAEQRTLGSLLSYVLEHGFRDLLAKDAIPVAAIEAYDGAGFARTRQLNHSESE